MLFAYSYRGDTIYEVWLLDVEPKILFRYTMQMPVIASIKNIPLSYKAWFNWRFSHTLKFA